ncbi:phosphomevalonate kinase [Dactylosporangium sp. NBC_01737]|uniref:phosphomevalonate kinase n=1 Tax=Dactylosporangium sp. NBC_01737 TaxID=2975959 RepID=UPI002E14EC60|nr:phosphomevalonate kinase [Dactylosporangium sp. NBC_01737]
MTAREPVTRHAPGKLFIAGEYAVLEPGHPAILVAVGRGVAVTVSATTGADVVVESDLHPAATRLRRRDGELAGIGADDAHRAQESLGQVTSAIEVVDQLLAERGRRMPPIRVSITSHLHRDGTKLGLGSSGAVTVATVAAVAAYCGLDLSQYARYRLAMLAAARRDPGGSGGDLAAGVWGGWIAYRAPDRTAVLDLAQRHGIEESMRVPWPGFGLRRLPTPRGLALEVGWTGQPVSSATLTGRLGTGRWWGSTAQQRFAARSDTCVLAAIRALERGDDGQLLQQIRTARRLLADLDDQLRLGIFTTRLTALCDAAEAAGGAAKPSGAGGGDCGIALLDATATREISQLRREWAAAGVLPLSTHLQPTNRSAA